MNLIWKTIVCKAYLDLKKKTLFNWFLTEKKNLFSEIIKTWFFMIIKITLYTLVFFISIRIFISETITQKSGCFFVLAMISISLKTAFDPIFDHLRSINLKMALSLTNFENRINKINLSL